MLINVVNDSANKLPEYAHAGDSGLDLRADFSKGLNDEYFHFAAFDEIRKVLIIFPGARALIPTNIKTELPSGYEFQIRPRSGLALKQGITVLNTPGTIDAPYRNYWGVILINLGDGEFEVSQGDKIAQAVLAKVGKVDWNLVTELSNTDRQLTGFGDSGIK